MRAIIDESFTKFDTIATNLFSPIVSVKLERIANRFTDSELIVRICYENNMFWWTLEEIFPMEPDRMSNILMRVTSEDGKKAQQKFSYLTRSKKVLQLAKGRLDESAWLGSVFVSDDIPYDKMKEIYRV